MERRGRKDGEPWMGWLASLVFGVVIAMVCMAWLGRATQSARSPSTDAVQAQQRSLGFEFTLRFRILLPEKAGE